MSMLADPAEQKHEIIIVKRGHDDHEGHHGGVWKIAFADFMTAMMCFFLVMWLINAANEQTKAAVASYFNPVKLIDRNSSRKGLEDIGDGPNAVGSDAKDPKDQETQSDSKSKGGATNDTKGADAAKVTTFSDEHMFADPYAVLAEIVSETGKLQNVSEKGDGGAQLAGPGTGASGGESYRDPFAPDFWSQQVAAPDAAESSAERSKMTGDKDDAEHSEPAPPVPSALPAEPLQPQAETAATVPPPPPAEKAVEEGPDLATLEAAAQIRQELADIFKPGEKVEEGLSVVATKDGVSISVTDLLDFGMFEIGSAVPRRDLVLAMEKIAKVLGERRGKVSISGHTDARPFRNANYDNWRLSTARAHSAYYMLVRGGLDETRVTEVGGYADRKPKNPADPLAAVNRRIEIVVEVGG